MGTKKFILDPVNSTRYNTNTKCKKNGEKSLKTYSVHFLHCIKVFNLFSPFFYQINGFKNIATFTYAFVSLNH